MSAILNLLKSPMFRLAERLNQLSAEHELKRLIVRLAGEGATDHDVEVLVFGKTKLEPAEYRKMTVFQRRDWLRAIMESSQEVAQPDLSKEQLALAALVAHPEWSDKDIADHVGCARTSLYRWEKYVAAREALERGRMEMPKADEI